MSFQQGLSGLNASSRNLDVIGHNIANANTTGMKASRAEFSELYAGNIGTSGGTAAGIGVAVSTVSQQFTQGNITTTGNSLDVSINGSGFFTVAQPNGDLAYTRAGNFKLDATGNIITNDGAKLQGDIIDPVTGAISKGALTVPTGKGVAGKETTTGKLELNLDTRAPVASAQVPPTPTTTYGTSLNVYDKQGAAIPVNLYFVKTGPNAWNAYTKPDASDTPTALTFDTSGKLLTPNPATMTLTGLQNAGSTSDPVSVAFDLSGMTQNASSFAVSDLAQNGYAPGQLTGMSIENDGTLTTRYSNGQTQSAGRVTLSNFRNVQGLEVSNGGYWKQTAASGAPITSNPGSGSFGQLRSGALEDSTVDLTGELVNMMTAQRAYQANAQTIKTQDQVMSTLVNLR
ncbi:flagellar hook protein FlgE [Xylophilus ampelinus]|uniref:Flagellar hook protein FlgE n=1 Tax=Xylophilus ampelinus TaxID=54067 RepID=A0A318SER3_9BURK|nr:flagellar hook protein FlgE [Xylophilus ampelinus]MCS4511228.1 flagellar hook protein FlgE [Xylophilus ampelinus]PYE75019.1 flagellar hook protein FlgE [Xylophilus ampelinus]